MNDYYGNKIKNMSVFVGKNGSGKTTVLDILGMCRQDRLKSSVKAREVEDEYLMLYYLGVDDNSQDLFGIELLGANILDNMIENYELKKEDIDYDKSKTSIGVVFKYVNYKFVSIGKHFFDYEMGNRRLNEVIKFAYVGESYRYSSRNGKYSDYNAWDGGYIAERRLISKVPVYTKYMCLKECIKNEIDGFNCSNAKILFFDEIDYDYKKNIDEEYDRRYADMVGIIEKKLPIWNYFDISSIKNEGVESFKKQKYICDLYSRYIMDMIVNGLYPLCKKEIDVSKNRINVLEHIDYVKGLAFNESSIDKLGENAMFEDELNQIDLLITELQKESQKDFLTIMARYVGSRIHKSTEDAEFGYVDVLEQMIEKLYQIPEECFTRQGVKFVVEEKEEKYQEDFLKVYSELYKKRNSWHSDIGSKFRICFEMLSEGEERFLDTIAKINDCVCENQTAQLLVLMADEPDQALHPEWSRRFVDIIVQAISKVEYEGDIQVILSTHSPYLISDILPSNVFLFERAGEKRMLNIQRMDKSNKVSCLGANIYDLMKNQFFMENAVGQFVTKKINAVVKEISELKEDTNHKVKKIECFIGQLGEPIIQKVMKKQLRDKMLELNMIQNKEDILEMITNQEDRIRVEEYLKMLEDKKYD